MNCETCDSQLLDLLYGELDATTAAAVREHLEGCASCAAARVKLEGARRVVRQLPLEDAPSRVHAALMARAEASARGERAEVSAPKRARGVVEDEQTPVQRFLGWLGGFVLGPQVAMALVLVLMVGVGLYYLPGLRTPRNVPGGAIVDPGDEAGPSAAIAPAAPLELHLDTRTNRLQAGESAADRAAEARAEASDTTPTGESEAQRAVIDGPLPEDPSATLAVVAPPAEQRAEGAAGGVVDEALDGESADVEIALAPGDAIGASTGPARPAPTRARDARTLAAYGAGAQPAADDAPRPDTVDSISAREESTAPAAFAERTVIAQGAPAQPAAAPAQNAAPAPVAPRAPAPATPAAPIARAARPTAAGSAPSAPPPPVAPSATSYGGGGSVGTGSASGGSAGGAPAQAQSPLLAAAGLHGVARNQARANSLRDAIGSYESLLSRFPSYDRGGEAMLELAELYRRVGDLTRARSWIARAERVPTYAARARQQRVRVDQMDSARRSVPSAAAPSAD